MFTDSELLEKINDYISKLTYAKNPRGLYEPIEYAMSLGGKRVRPVLMMMAYNLYHDDVDRILSQAAGIEMYHNYSLMHDDLMDNSDMRRGKPTVHKKWGRNTALLSGDAMLMIAYKLMTGSGGSYVPPVMRLFSETAMQICEGQQLDMEFETRNDVYEHEYLEMIRLKTSVLLAASLKIGDDILSNKKTYLLIQALRRGNEEQVKELKKWLEAKDFDPVEKIKSVTALFDEIDVRSLCEDRIAHYTLLAETNIDMVKVPEEKKQLLVDEMNKLMHREA